MSDKLVVPMSSSGHCIKALVASYLKYPAKEKPSWLAQTAEEGNLHEDAIKAKLRNEGYVIEDDREECQICKAKYGSGRRGIHVEVDNLDFVLVGHLDGKTGHQNTSRRSLLECKSMSEREFYRWLKGGFKEFHNYACQLTCYMNATGIYNALYVVKNRNNGKTERYELNSAPANFVDICSKLQLMTEYIKNNTMPNVDYDDSSVECQRCEYIGLCIPEVKEADPATMEQLKHALSARDLAKHIIKEEEKIVYDHEDIIKNYLKNTRLKQRQFGWAMSLTLGRTKVSYPVESLLMAGVTEEQLNKAKVVSNPWDGLWLKNLNEED